MVYTSDLVLNDKKLNCKDQVQRKQSIISLLTTEIYNLHVLGDSMSTIKNNIILIVPISS